MYDQENIIKLLLENYSITAQYIYKIALKNIIQYRSVKILKILLEHGADPTNDYTLIQTICYNGWSNLLNILLKKHNIVEDNDYFTNAIINGNINIIKLLMYKCKLKPNILNIQQAIFYEKIEVLQYLFKNGISANMNDNELLLYAINLKKYNNIKYDIIKLIIENGADPCAKNNTPIQLACSCKFDDDRIVKLLLEYTKVDPTVNNNAPLCIAIRYGCYSIVRLLLSIVNHPVDPTADNYSPLKYAIHYYHHNINSSAYDILLLLCDDYRINLNDVPSLHQMIDNIIEMEEDDDDEYLDRGSRTDEHDP
jgi:ankyrin repeat protein